jgi:hypothetical protein
VLTLPVVRALSIRAGVRLVILPEAQATEAEDTRLPLVMVLLHTLVIIRPKAPRTVAKAMFLPLVVLHTLVHLAILPEARVTEAEVTRLLVLVAIRLRAPRTEAILLLQVEPRLVTRLRAPRTEAILLQLLVLLRTPDSASLHLGSAAAISASKKKGEDWRVAAN